MSLSYQTVLYKFCVFRHLQEKRNLYHSLSDTLGLNKKYREGVMEEEALKEVLKDRRCDENPKIKELEKMVVER